MFPQARSMIDSQQKAWHRRGKWHLKSTEDTCIDHQRMVLEEPACGRARKKWWWSKLHVPQVSFPFQPQFSLSASRLLQMILLIAKPHHSGINQGINCLPSQIWGWGPRSGWRTFLRPQFLRKFPRRSGTFPTFGWGCNSFPQRVVVGLPSGASRCLLVGIAFGWGFKGLEDCFFPPAVQSIEGCEG